MTQGPPAAAGAQPPGALAGGANLGLPAVGAGSLASFGRRLVAVVVDWFAATAVVGLITHGRMPYGSPTFSWSVLAVFGVQVWALTWLGGASFGQRLLGLRVIALDVGRVPLGRAALRTLLLCAAIPPLVWDRDGRGLHDRATLTAVVRLPAVAAPRSPGPSGQ